MNFDYPVPVFRGIGGGCPHCWGRPVLRLDLEQGDWYCSAGCGFRYKTPQQQDKTVSSDGGT